MLEDLVAEVGWNLRDNCLHDRRSEESSLALVPPQELDGLILKEQFQVYVVWCWAKDLLHDTTGDVAVEWDGDVMRLEVVCLEELLWILFI